MDKWAAMWSSLMPFRVSPSAQVNPSDAPVGCISAVVAAAAEADPSGAAAFTR